MMKIFLFPLSLSIKKQALLWGTFPLLFFVVLTFLLSVADPMSLVAPILFCCDPRFWPRGYSVILWLIVACLTIDLVKMLLCSWMIKFHHDATNVTGESSQGTDGKRSSSFARRMFRYFGRLCLFRSLAIQIRIFLGFMEFVTIMAALGVLIYSLPFVFFDPLRQGARENLAIVDYTWGDYFSVVTMIIVSLWPLFIAGLLALTILLCWYLKKYHAFLLLLFLLSVSTPCLLAVENKPIKKSPLVLLEKASPEKLTARQLAVITRSFSRPVGPEDGGFLSNQQVIACFDAYSYQYTGGRYVDETFKFRLYQPSQPLLGRKYPLIIWFHGARESDTDNTRQLAHMHSILDLFMGDQRQDFYLLATQCPADNQSWGHSVSAEGKGDAPLTITWEILQHLLEEFPVDRERISLVGICSGGAGALEFLLQHPEVPSSVVLCSSTAPFLNATKAQELTKTTIWAFNNVHEEDAYDSMQRFFATIREVGGRTHLTPIYDETDIHYTWVPALYQWKSVHWLLTQRRGGHHPPPGVLCELHSATSLFWLFGLPGVVLVTLIFVRKRLFQNSAN